MRIASGVQISSELEYLRMFVHSFLSVFCTSRHSSIAHPLYLSFRVICNINAAIVLFEYVCVCPYIFCVSQVEAVHLTTVIKVVFISSGSTKADESIWTCHLLLTEASCVSIFPFEHPFFRLIFIVA